jgi:SsrA-binding protein
MKQKNVPGQKIICLNRKASFNYFFLEVLEAGISLKGSEVKSLRDGKASIADSYAIDKNGEIYLINSHIPLYKQSSYNNHDPKGDRKLLLKKKEINKLIGRVNQEGLTLIPTKLYFKKGKAKIQIAVGK